MLPVSEKVYNLFEDELKKSLEDAQRFFKAPSSEQGRGIKALGTKFHTIKGGAGFLGFSEVASIASQLESLLLKSSESLTARLEKAELMIRELEQVVQSLPSRSSGGTKST